MVHWNFAGMGTPAGLELMVEKDDDAAFPGVGMRDAGFNGGRRGGSGVGGRGGGWSSAGVALAAGGEAFVAGLVTGGA